MTLPLQKELLSVSHDPLRPRYHFLPPANWINDPNGFIYWQGVYHLFYQYNPHGAFWGTIHWGHASSTDLVNWEHHPIALRPGPDPYDKDGCWSGCAINDAGTPTLFYTGKEQELERICIARGDANLQNWRKESANPIIAAVPAELNASDFRDPFVWYEDGAWWMVIGSGIRGQGGAVLLYTSPDLLHWEYLQPLLVGDGTSGTMWECPTFFRLGARAALMVSVLPFWQVWMFVGTYQWGTFVPGRPILLDGGSIFYAPQAIRDTAGRHVVLGWLKEEQERKAGWSGVISLPRILAFLADGRLTMQPIPALKQLRYHEQSYTTELSPGDTTLINGNRLGQWECEGTILPATEGLLTLTLADEQQEYSTIFINLTQQTCGRGITQQAVEKWLSYHVSSDATLHIDCFFDHSVLEVFIQHEQCFTSRVYPISVATTHLKLGLQGSRGLSVQLQLWDLHDAEFRNASLENGRSNDHA